MNLALLHIKPKNTQLPGMRLRIRNMESDRCKSIVKEELINLGLSYLSVELGEVEFTEDVSNEQLQQFNTTLKKSGLELIVDNKSLLVGKIKLAIKHLVYCSNYLDRPVSSEYIKQKVNFDYNYLSKTFSEIEGITIEKYIILQRIERIKSLLITGKFSLSEIAYMLLYSSVAHLSNQFKKVTGLTPSDFRKLKDNRYQNPVSA